MKLRDFRGIFTALLDYVVISLLYSRLRRSPQLKKWIKNIQKGGDLK